MNSIVVDLFAGPGGLGEGFSAFEAAGDNPFHIELAVECEPYAHKTLELRAFFRELSSTGVLDDYYRYLRKEITRDELFGNWPDQARRAQAIAVCKRLGQDNEVIHDRIGTVLDEYSDEPLVIVGGPPCQAYSQVGRSRLRKKREEEPDEYAKDERHRLYEQYLGIIRKFKPHAFIMENVPGMLSHTLDKERIFDKVLRDLQNPWEGSYCPEGYTYNTYSLVRKSENGSASLSPHDYIVHAERYGIPQARHRVIILGLRSDITVNPGVLKLSEKTLTVDNVIGDLPALRSRISKDADSFTDWKALLVSARSSDWYYGIDMFTRGCIDDAVENIDDNISTGGEYVKHNVNLGFLADWFYDKNLGGVCNHSSRSHIKDDILRYFYAACYTQGCGDFPRIHQYPQVLWPKHRNVQESGGKTVFADRFRVQAENKPASTITCHISKDGHYYIHPDPSQARSLTVREAARLQTFPDNYFFEGNRTSQYHQVGNAVPPWLSCQIARIVYEVLRKHYNNR